MIYTVEYQELKTIYLNECREYISNLLNTEQEDINLKCFNCDTILNIAYLGGRHPECDSNVFATAESIINKDGNIIVVFDNGYEQYLIDCLTDDVICIAEFLEEFYNHEFFDAQFEDNNCDDINFLNSSLNQKAQYFYDNDIYF